MDEELAFVDAVANPIEAHVDGFGAALFDSVVGDTSSACVVGSHWGGWLWRAQYYPHLFYTLLP